MPQRPPAPDVYDALFGELPEGWRERKGLPPEGQRADDAADADEQDRQDGKDAPDTPGSPPRMPGAPASPWHLSRASWFTILKNTVKQIGEDRVTSVAGGVVYFALLALFPAITALVSIYGWVADRDTIIESVDLLSRFLPPGAVELVAGQIVAIASAPATALSLAGIVSILLALWTTNGGMKALLQALNVAWYETEKRGFIMLNVVSLAMTLGAILLIIVMIVAITILPTLVRVFAPGSMVEGLVTLLRWPLMFGALLLALAVLYRFGPSKNDPKWQWISPGALLAAVGLIIASVLFSWYVANFGNYNETYGSLGAVVVLMLWLWIAAIVVLVGAELNSETERRIKIENGVAPQDEQADSIEMQK
ncbi:YihY/virulence factor BrkB family protein [Paracoccus sp. Z118]|uniref:YihY/virulence factor BrkB family protein n=1 Tax=Paracoccus sp. Z118 TaxID=2851017 RepID=UPI001C2BA715|nr:YihY/virulence factor BrkB family protein [Paracoccus sp. Z118]MBV0890574.1 YihY/virulence factor BrkB family protein [Paracoccus sp. Z118]